NLEDVEGLLVVTQEELLQRAKAKTPNAVHVGVNNFLSTPKYDEIVEKLKK
ncbi:MAG: PTS mannitol transporter subunit IIBC, partial [Trichococcus sp.]